MKAHAATAADLAPGDHVCWRFGDDDSHREALAGFIDGGRRDNYKIVHYRADLDEPDVPGFGRFVSTPVDVTRPFDADAWIAMLVEVVEQARAEGFAGVRFAGEMAWSRGHLADERLIAYERQINAFYAQTGAIGLCLYDTRRFEPGVLAEIGRVHPDTATADGDGDAPLARLAVTGAPLGVRLTGEFDASNGGCLEPVLADLVPHANGHPLVVDVAALRFADLTAVTALLRAARTVPGGLRILGAEPTLERIVRLCGPAPVVFA
ncbi:MEDS domain-containing protein [Dactylosporangium sp. NPDC000244]|uniref:MEDS domain-containing protein n=1 Tax=Dactylosporangium sp. NPDC000244 TaxID=3154365 RepID=UPI00331F2294